VTTPGPERGSRRRTLLGATAFGLGGLAPLATGLVGIRAYLVDGFFVAKTGERVDGPEGLVVCGLLVLAGLGMIGQAVRWARRAPAASGVPRIARRPGRESDRAFLHALHRRALGPWIEATYGPWDEDWQREHFRRTTRPEAHEILEHDGEPIGCVLVSDRGSHLELERIELLPEHQGRGIGAEMVGSLLATARDRGVPVRLQVFRESPAVRFYERLGFRRTGETETHVRMEHAPE
jgi:ribosomal protein S18 acetylase RimI-like enzyme